MIYLNRVDIHKKTRLSDVSQSNNINNHIKNEFSPVVCDDDISPVVYDDDAIDIEYASVPVGYPRDIAKAQPVTNIISC